MTYHCFISEDASKDIASAIEWYEDKEEGRGDLFEDAIIRKIDLLKQTPRMHATWKKQYHRGKVKDYPYSVFYTVSLNSIEIIAVLHDHLDIDSVLRERT